MPHTLTTLAIKPLCARFCNITKLQLTIAAEKNKLGLNELIKCAYNYKETSYRAYDYIAKCQVSAQAINQI